MTSASALFVLAALAVCGHSTGFQVCGVFHVSTSSGTPLLRRMTGKSVLALRASNDEPSLTLPRRKASQTLATAVGGLLVTAGAQRAAAFCPPDCNFGSEEGKKNLRGLSDVKVVAKEEGKKEKKETLVASSSAEDALPPVDLSILEQRQQVLVTDKAFFDVTVGDDATNTSRIVVALFGKVVPETVKNFKQLVTGAKGYGYEGTTFYRIVKDLQISGGDVLKNGGKSGKSALNEDVFPQENFRIMHSVPGVVSMQNTLDKQVDSRFFISTRSNVDLGYSKIFDGKYVAFGLVIEGMDVVDRLNNLETKQGIFDKGIKSGRPKEEIVIRKCGLLQGPPAPLSAASSSSVSTSGDKPVFSGAQLSK